jgi:hypothetical protein
MVQMNALWRRCVFVSVCVLLVSGVWCASAASVTPVSSVSRSDSHVARVNRTFVYTSGALTPLKPHDFTNFTVLGGPAVEVKLFGALFDLNIAQLLMLHLVVPVYNLSFSVNYSRVSLFPLLRHRYSPVSFVVNGSGIVHYRNKAHTLVVTGFTGVFQFDRAKLIKGGLARFGFEGVARGVSVTRW